MKNFVANGHSIIIKCCISDKNLCETQKFFTNIFLTWFPQFSLSTNPDPHRYFKLDPDPQK